MRLLDRYLLRELLIPLSYCLGGFLLFWVAFDLFRELAHYRSKGLLVSDIAEYYLITTPEFLILVLPISLLLALLYAITNHARHQELTAIRSAGVSLWRICLPYFIVGLLVSLAAFAINELWVPGSTEAAEEILNRRSNELVSRAQKGERDMAFVNMRDHRFWAARLYQPDRAEMIRPQVLWTGPDGEGLRLTAERAIYTNQSWTFSNATMYRESSPSNSMPEPLLQTNSLPMPQFTETPELISSEIRVSKSLRAGQARKSDLAIRELLNYRRLHPNIPAADRAWLNTKLQGRLAAPWACLVVVLIAIPFGAGSGRRNVFVGVASSIVICFVYFVLQQLGLALGSGGYLPAWLAAWMPNIFFGINGILLTMRVR